MPGLRAVFLAAVFSVVAGGCGTKENPVDPSQRLCGGEAGLGVFVEGRAQPVEFCLDDGDVAVTLTSGLRYDIAGQVTSGKDVFQVRMVFALRTDFPVSLHPVDNLTDVTGNPDAVWIQYEEFPGSGSAIESFTVTNGTFRLGFSDVDVLAGTFEDVSLDMRTLSTGDPAGSRVLSQGFFSLSVKNPTAVAAVEAQ